MYTQALKVGLMPFEFWELTIQEAEDVISARVEQKNDEIYAQANLIRIAILSAFSPDVTFPSAPASGNKNKASWQNSKSYFKQIQQSQGGCKK